MKRIFFFALVSGLGGAFGLSLPLRVKNMAAYSYSNVPVQAGIPFPLGKLTAADLTNITVSDAATHAALPAGAAITTRWHDGSVRWLRIIFPATVAQGGTANYVLSDAGKNRSGGLSAFASGNSVTVITGPLKFTVKGANFNLIDEAWMDESGGGAYDAAHQVVQTGNAGGFYVKTGSGELRSNAVTATVTLVDQNGYYALVRASGKVGSFPFVVFYYAYAGKPFLKVVHNFYYDNSDGFTSSGINLADLSLRLLTRVAGGTATFSGTAADLSTTVASGEESFLHYANEDAYTVRKGAATLGSGKGMNETLQGAKNMGWAHMTDGSLGVGLCVRWIWEMAPKNLSLHGSGEAGIHLYSNKGAPLPFYGGAGRTHFAGIAFTKSVDAVKEMFYAVTQPLYAAAPPAWLTAQTKTFGGLVPCEPATFSTTLTAMINQYKMMGYVHGHSDRKKLLEGEDGYGFLQFGDLDDPRYGNGCAGKHWANNYYDYPHCIAQAYLMTASEYDLESGTAHALHLGDMDHSSSTGQSRTGPGFRSDGFGDYTTCDIGYSPTANHYKCQGMFDWACLLGEPLLGEIGLRMAQWAKGYPSGELRATGHVIQSLAGAYGYSNDAQWKTSLETFYAQNNMTAVSTGADNFMQAIIAEGLMWTLIELPGYAPALSALQAWADAWTAAYNMTGHTVGDYADLAGWYLGGFGYAWNLFPAKHTAWQPAMQDLWTTWSTGVGSQGDGRLKTFTQKFRAPPHYFHVAAKTGYNPMLPDYWTATETVSGAETAVRDLVPHEILVFPNPATGRSIVSIPFLERNGRSSVQAGIYDPRGRRVAAPLPAGPGQFLLDTEGLSNGVYLIKFTTGSEMITKKILVSK